MPTGRSSFISIILICLFGVSLHAADWPQWRGIDSDGIAHEKIAVNEQIPKLKQIWKTGVGEGCSSPIVVKDKVYVTGWNGNKETVFCLNASSGKTEWTQSYSCPKYGRHAKGDKNWYSGPTSTPTFDLETNLLYTLSSDGDLNCWDTSKKGKKVWGINLYSTYKMGRRPNVGGGQRDYGYTTAPFLLGQQLLMAVGGKAGLVVALDKANGKQLWTSESKEPASNCGGIVTLDVDGMPCVAVLSLSKLLVMRTDKGHQGKTVAQQQWQTDYANNLVTPTPVGKGRLLLSSAYNISKLVMFQVTKSGMKEIWSNRNFSGVATPVVFDGHIYMPYKRLRCLKLDNGKKLWEGGSYGSDGSSLVTADGYVVAFGNGTLRIVPTQKHSAGKYQELASVNGVCRKNQGWPHVVLSNGRIFCKDRQGTITCFAFSQ